MVKYFHLGVEWNFDRNTVLDMPNTCLEEERLEVEDIQSVFPSINIELLNHEEHHVRYCFRWVIKHSPFFTELWCPVGDYRPAYKVAVIHIGVWTNTNCVMNSTASGDADYVKDLASVLCFKIYLVVCLGYHVKNTINKSDL